jgi:hypothetical protein
MYWVLTYGATDFLPRSFHCHDAALQYAMEMSEEFGGDPHAPTCITILTPVHGRHRAERAGLGVRSEARRLQVHRSSRWRPGARALPARQGLVRQGAGDRRGNARPAGEVRHARRRRCGGRRPGRHRLRPCWPAATARVRLSSTFSTCLRSTARTCAVIRGKSAVRP